VRGAPGLNVIVEKFRLKLSKASTKSCPRLPNSTSMTAFARTGRIETSFNVTVLVPTFMTTRGWMYVFC